VRATSAEPAVLQRDLRDACNSQAWQSTAADKILWHTLMAGTGLPVPEALAVTQAARQLRGAATIADAKQLADFLRQPTLYPLFAKSPAGRYSLDLLSLKAYDHDTDAAILLGGEWKIVQDVACSMGGGAGCATWSASRRVFPRSCGIGRAGGMTGPCASAGRPDRPCAQARRLGATSPTNARLTASLSSRSHVPRRGKLHPAADGRTRRCRDGLRGQRRAARLRPECLAAGKDFIHVPLVPWSWSEASQAVGDTRAELLAPPSRCLVGDDNAALGQDQLNIPQSEAEHMAEPDCVADNLGGEPMAVVGVGGGFMPPVSPTSGQATRPGYRDNALAVGDRQCPTDRQGHAHVRQVHLADTSITSCEAVVTVTPGIPSDWKPPPIT
jgi:hypothetical protein